MTWNPDMSAAPRDGTEVLVGRKGFKPEIQSRKDGVATSMGPTGWGFQSMAGKIGMMPTHWQPLPPPPTEDSK